MRYTKRQREAYRNSLPVYRAFMGGESAASIAERLGTCRANVYKKVRYVETWGKEEATPNGFTREDYAVIEKRNALVVSLCESGVPRGVVARHFRLRKGTVGWIVRKAARGQSWR